mgnify:FL=1
MHTGSVAVDAQGIQESAFTKVVGSTVQFIVTGSLVPVQASNVTVPV